MPGTTRSGNRSGRPRAPGAGAKRKLIIQHRGEAVAMFRAGDMVALHDGAGITLTTVSLHHGMIVLTNEDGHTLTLIRAE